MKLEVLETFLRDLGPFRHDSITQICQLHIHDLSHFMFKTLYLRIVEKRSKTLTAETLKTCKYLSCLLIYLVFFGRNKDFKKEVPFSQRSPKSTFVFILHVTCLVLKINIHPVIGSVINRHRSTVRRNNRTEKGDLDYNLLRTPLSPKMCKGQTIEGSRLIKVNEKTNQRISPIHGCLDPL